MVLFFVVLLIIACVLLGFIILVQNPKGGGLASNVGGFSNQLMGVKQTTDVLEKGTWVMAAIVALFCLFSTLFVPKASAGNRVVPGAVTPSSVPANQVPANPTPGTHP